MFGLQKQNIVFFVFFNILKYRLFFFQKEVKKKKKRLSFKVIFKLA